MIRYSNIKTLSLCNNISNISVFLKRFYTKSGNNRFSVIYPDGFKYGGENEPESFLIHKPVMFREVVHHLEPKSGDVIVDCTFGLGGHSRAILESNKNVYVIGIDRDPSVFKYSKELKEKYKDRLITLNGRFSNLDKILQENNLSSLKISGILMDFGLSSYQIDTSDRGFSFKKDLDGPLDMRMDNSINGNNGNGMTAAQLLNTGSISLLRDIFYYYGEERFTKNLVEKIIQQRQNQPFEKCSELVKVIESCIPYPMAAKSINRVFRGLRMYINEEIQEIKNGLIQAEKLLKPNGNLVTISFHSIEDRIVKDFFKTSTNPNKDNDYNSDFIESNLGYFKINNENQKNKNRSILPSFEMLNDDDDPKFPTPQELEWNSRSKSAILRYGKRTSSPPILNQNNLNNLF